ncbi:MAG: response regulator [Deltaproteobacteria bacterium]|nr:response regulator [Deltaproteobacteria bacterium]
MEDPMEKKKILVVDDDQDLALGLRVRLRANNYGTVLATDAVSAISQAKQETPDLILLDLGLPAGDGFIVMERLNNIESLASIPVIVLSARDPQLNRERALAAGARAYFQKPVDNDELMTAIGKSLGELN